LRIEPSPSFVSLGVADLERAARFYEPVIKFPQLQTIPEEAGLASRCGCHFSLLFLPLPALRGSFNADRWLRDRCVSDTPPEIFSKNVKKLLIPGTAIL